MMVAFLLSILTLPWNTLCTMLLPGCLVPPSPRCRLLRNQLRNSAGSECASLRYLRFDSTEIAWKSSCGETCPLNAPSFQILRSSSPKRSTSSDLQCL